MSGALLASLISFRVENACSIPEAITDCNAGSRASGNTCAIAHSYACGVCGGFAESVADCDANE